MDQERSVEVQNSNLHSNPLGNPLTHPWSGFVHSEHKSEELEPLLRTLRFASIQLGKFWVEFNAFPMFMNEMKGASIRQIEQLFDWFQASPSWSARVALPRLVPELCAEASRARLLEFTHNVVRARMIRGWIAQSLGLGLVSQAELTDAIQRLALSEKLGLELGLTQGGLAETEEMIREVGERLERNRRLQEFFARIVSECGLGSEATRTSEAQRLFQAVELARATPLDVWQWRRPQIIAPQSRARILAWQERARPLLEARERLEPKFKTEERVAAAQLRLLAEKIQAGGWFRGLSKDYKASLARYRSLLRLESGAKPPKESQAQMAAHLVDWAGFLERRAQIEDAAEAKALFSPGFRGIDTQFDAALEANMWATTVRTELESEDKGAQADFCSRLADSLFETSQERLLRAVELCSGSNVQAIQGILIQPEYASDREFAALGCDEEARWMSATQLRAHLIVLGLKPTVKLSALVPVRTATAELLALVKGIDAHPEARAAFKHTFAGENTDLGLLEGAQDYIDFVRGTGLSEGLKASFLTAHGPQRLHDTRALVAPALGGLAHVKEHLRRLEVATHGQSRALEELPMLDLIQRIGLALKQPALLTQIVARAQELS